MKLGVSTYSYSSLIKSGAISQFDIIEKAVEMGFDIVEFSGLAVPQGKSPEEYAAAIKEECEAKGIQMGNYTIPADFLTGSGGDLDAEIERLKAEVRIAHILGATGMRHDAANGFKTGHCGPKGFIDALPLLAKGCRAVTEYAASFGIKTMIENHGFFCQDSDRVESLINAVDNENFGLLLDIGNFMCVDEDPSMAVGKLAPYAFHVHAKDFHTKKGTAPHPGEGWFCSRGGNYLRGAIIGHGEVPMVQCLNIIKKAGYDKTLSIEFEGLENPYTGIAIGLKNLKSYLGQ